MFSLLIVALAASPGFMMAGVGLGVMLGANARTTARVVRALPNTSCAVEYVYTVHNETYSAVGRMLMCPTNIEHAHVPICYDKSNPRKSSLDVSGCEHEYYTVGVPLFCLGAAYLGLLALVPCAYACVVANACREHRLRHAIV